MHPRYISKSDFPEGLLTSVGLRSIGSRSTSIKPEKWGIEKHPDNEVITEQVFVAGTKAAYHQWSDKINSWSADQKSTPDFRLKFLPPLRPKGFVFFVGHYNKFTF
jgi:hypothetical protein